MLSWPFTRRKLRHTARLTLFAWVFALLSGTANACLLQLTPQAELEAIQSRAGTSVSDTAGHATQPVQHVHHQGEDDGDGNDPAKVVCLKFCADESSAVVKGKALHADALFSVHLFGVVWQLTAPVVAPSEWIPVERPASVGPPLFIRLRRLTI